MTTEHASFLIGFSARLQASNDLVQVFSISLRRLIPESHIMFELTNLSATCRWRSCFLVVLLLLHCIGLSNCEDKLATILSDTTLLEGCGSDYQVITTISQGDEVMILGGKIGESVFDDNLWLCVYVPKQRLYGYVADYFSDCGHVGYCNPPSGECPV